MEKVLKYFPDLTDLQKERFEKLSGLYKDWNEKINVVSRKDIDELYLRHVLHSLAIAKIQPFNPGSKIIDVGTGGGFPGIPLAILFPETTFDLIDSRGKKIKVVDEVVNGLELENVHTFHERVEKLKRKNEYDFIVSRAVARMDTFVNWTKGKIAKKSEHKLRNGILYLKGGDLEKELAKFKTAKQYPLKDIFEEEFFNTKVLVHLPQKFKG